MNQVISIVAGKGGVGKSTVAVNLAVALARTGKKVALIDADLYGPSIPTMFGGGEIHADHEQKLIPPAKFGVKYISLGFFLPDPDSPVIWRGPLFGKALRQMFDDVRWGEVDITIVDMPPGTGDAHITLSQMESVKLSGSIVVTTPQEVALADVRKAMNMLIKVNIPILGVVENLAGFTIPGSSETVMIFGQGGGEAVAKSFGVPILTSLPILPEIREGGDSGIPVAWGGSEKLQDKFFNLAEEVIKLVDKQASLAVNIVN
jgi:ATP-binding protein involved in chromosome partitioning